jgi:hypothetical protein
VKHTKGALEDRRALRVSKQRDARRAKTLSSRFAMALKRWFLERYFTVDPRALGAGRIVLASVLLLDLARRARDLETWYTNDGLLPNHTTLWKPPFDHTLSLFFTASLAPEAAVGFILCGVAYAMLLFGVRTRFAQLTSLVAVLSLHGRCEFVQNGGDAVLGELTLWTCFLPLGRRYSIDAVRAARVAGDPSPERRKKRVVSLAMCVLLAQLAVIYLFNALQKTGETWRAGSVVHYMLYQSCNDTALALLVRDHFTWLHSKILTWTAWGIEGALPLFVLCPFAQRYTRRVAALLVALLHGGFATFLNLGIFVPAMLAFTPYLIVRADWDVLERTVARFGLGARVAHEPAWARRAYEWLVAHASEPATERAARRSFFARPEVGAGVLLVAAACAVSQLLVENNGVTHFQPEWQPKWMHATAAYLQTYQGWAMYAPDPPLSDVNIVVDAVTGDGRHVDPFNEVASPLAPRPGIRIPPRLGQDVLFFAYVLRLPWTPEYYQAFEEWILLYPHRTGQARDNIVSFEAFLVERDSPPPGEHQLGPPRSRTFLKYPHH